MSIETYTEEHRILNPARTPELPEPMTGEELYEHLAAKIDELNGPKGQIFRARIGSAALLGTVSEGSLTVVRIPIVTAAANTFVIGLGGPYTRMNALIIPEQSDSIPDPDRPLMRAVTRSATKGFEPHDKYDKVTLGISNSPIPYDDPNQPQLRIGHRSVLVPGLTRVWASALGARQNH